MTAKRGKQKTTEARRGKQKMLAYCMPVCPVHGIVMIAYKTEEKIRRFRCQVAECNERGKAARDPIQVD